MLTQYSNPFVKMALVGMLIICIMDLMLIESDEVRSCILFLVLGIFYPGVSVAATEAEREHGRQASHSTHTRAKSQSVGPSPNGFLLLWKKLIQEFPQHQLNGTMAKTRYKSWGMQCSNRHLPFPELTD